MLTLRGRMGRAPRDGMALGIPLETTLIVRPVPLQTIQGVVGSLSAVAYND